MFIDKFINAALRKIWPENKDGDRAVRFHSQNLNEDRNGDAKGLPHHGRWWLHLPVGETRFEWALWNPHRIFSVHLKTDGESGGLQFHWTTFPSSFYLTLPIRLAKYFKSIKYDGRNFFDISLGAESGSLHWQFGGNEHGDWSSRTPKWKHGSFNIPDFILGKQKYVEGDPEVHKVKIPMPEGAYDATVEMRDDKWVRPRWFTLKLRRAKIDVPQGIPYPGKGENSWDCGEDASFGLSCPAETVEQAIGKQVESVLRSRRRHGGSVMLQYLPPEKQVKGAASKRIPRA